MRKYYSFERFFEGNQLVRFCVLFTIAIAAEAVLSAIAGATIYLNIEYVIWTAVFLSAPILPLAVFQRLWKSNYISEKDYLFWLSIPLHYLVSCALILLFTFIQRFFLPLPISIYLLRFVYYTAGYIVIMIGAIIIDLMQTASSNKNLRKIQARQCDASKTQGE